MYKHLFRLSGGQPGNLCSDDIKVLTRPERCLLLPRQRRVSFCSGRVRALC